MITNIKEILLLPIKNMTDEKVNEKKELIVEIMLEWEKHFKERINLLFEGPIDEAVKNKRIFDLIMLDRMFHNILNSILNKFHSEQN